MSNTLDFLLSADSPFKSGRKALFYVYRKKTENCLLIWLKNCGNHVSSLWKYPNDKPYFTKTFYGFFCFSFNLIMNCSRCLLVGKTYSLWGFLAQCSCYCNQMHWEMQQETWISFTVTSLMKSFGEVHSKQIGGNTLNENEHIKKPTYNNAIAKHPQGKDTSYAFVVESILVCIDILYQRNQHKEPRAQCCLLLLRTSLQFSGGLS